MGIAIFEALADIQYEGQWTPGQGHSSFFTNGRAVQHFFAIGIHCIDDSIPFEIATADFADQMRTPLATHKLKIMAMTPAYHDKGEYTTRIQFHFEDGALPFLINP